MNQERLLERLKNAASSGSLSHAYILEGTKNSGKEELARKLARSLTPYAEDITIISMDGKSVKDEAVENLQERLSLKPMVGDLNVAIVEDADTMTVRAQNRFLKTLEEPPGGAVIFLLSENRSNLLPTILSRCVLQRVGDEDSGEAGETDQMKDLAAETGGMLLSPENFYAFFGILDVVTKEKETAIRFLDALEEWYRDVILAAAGVKIGGLFAEHSAMSRWSMQIEPQKGQRAVKLIEEARSDILKNVNAGYAIKNLILKIQVGR